MPINVHKICCFIFQIRRYIRIFYSVTNISWIGIIIPKIYNNLQDKFDEGSVQVVSNFFVTFLFGNEFVWKTRVKIFIYKKVHTIIFNQVKNRMSWGCKICILVMAKLHAHGTPLLRLFFSEHFKILFVIYAA